jgi:hypothetical protein
MRIKIEKAMLYSDRSRHVYVTIRTGIFKREAWVFVCGTSDVRWHARRNLSGEGVPPKKILEPRHMARFMRMLPKIAFETEEETV